MTFSHTSSLQLEQAEMLQTGQPSVKLAANDVLASAAPTKKRSKKRIKKRSFFLQVAMGQTLLQYVLPL